MSFFSTAPRGATLALALLAGLGAPAVAAPVSVEALVTKALSQVPSLESVQATARAQRAREAAAGATYWPQVSLGANYARQQNISPAAFNGPQLDTGAGNLTLRQELFNFGQVDAQVAVARAAAEASEAQAQLAAVQVSYGVRQAYVQWAQAHALEAQAQAQRRNAKAVLARAQSFFKHGARPRIDVTRASVVLAQAQASLVEAQNAVELARRSLETAIGGEAIAGEPQFPDEPAIARASRDELVALTRRQHPSLVASQALVRSTQAGRQYAERLAMPSLSANMIGGMRAQAVQVAPDWQAGLNLAMPVFTGFSIERQQEAAAEAERAARADLKDRDLQLALGVDRAYLALGGARQKLVALRAARASALENFQLAQNRYRDGVGSIIEVSDAQTLLAGAEAERVRGEGNLHLAIAELARAVGLTGLEPDSTQGKGR